MTLSSLDKGEKVDVHLSLYANEIAVIDRMCVKHNCSRASVIGAMIAEFSKLNLAGKVKEGRRPGGGRKRKEKPNPLLVFPGMAEILKR